MFLYRQVLNIEPGHYGALSAHTFDHSFVTHLLESGVSIHTVQALLGHNSIETTQVYLHVMRKPGKGLHSPEDMLE